VMGLSECMCGIAMAACRFMQVITQQVHNMQLPYAIKIIRGHTHT